MDVQLFAITHSLEAVDALLQSIEAMENLNGQKMDKIIPLKILFYIV